MKYQLRIALRYVFTKRSFHIITVISFISLVGIVIGVAALIAVLSIFNGFRDFTEQQLIGFDPHLRIIPKEKAWIQNSANIFAVTDKIKGIKNISPVIQGRIIGIKGNNMQVFTLNAIDYENLKGVSDISKKTIMGTFYLGKTSYLPTIVLGAGVADKIKALPGDTISLVSPRQFESSIKSFTIPNPVKAFVTGIFQTNYKDFDNLYCYSTEEIGKLLFNPPPNSVSVIDIKLHDIKKVNEYKTKISELIPNFTEVLSWYDLHKQLYDIMNFERTMTFIIISLIVIIAAFNILASLSMTVVEKRQDIGILKAIGSSDRDIMKIFLLQGSIIGLISTVLGVLLGLGFCFGQIEYGWFKLDSSNFLIKAIPLSIKSLDIVIISFFSIILSILASVYPAKRAASTIVINSIRSE